MLNVTKCNCGAITVSNENFSNSMKGKNLKLFFPQLKKPIKSTVVHCNHCVNNYGLDLCACGSGEDPKKCKNKFKECGTAKEEIGLSVQFAGWRR